MIINHNIVVYIDRGSFNDPEELIPDLDGWSPPPCYSCGLNGWRLALYFHDGLSTFLCYGCLEEHFPDDYHEETLRWESEYEGEEEYIERLNLMFDDREYAE